MADIIGIPAAVHDPCLNCGGNVTFVTHRRLVCDACGCSRGRVGADLRAFLESFVEQFGRPDRPIILRSGKLHKPEPPASAAKTATKKRKGKPKMKMSDLFPSKYLRAADLQGKTRTVVIDHVTHEDFKDDGVTVKKTILHFKGNGTAPVVCNKTNWKMLVAISGEDDDENWAGQKIVLRSEKVSSKGGKIVDSIRIHEAPEPVKADTDLIDELDDEVIV